MITIERDRSKDYTDEVALALDYTDLIVSESICLLAEQIQNCPSHINVIFHRYRDEMDQKKSF